MSYHYRPGQVIDTTGTLFFTGDSRLYEIVAMARAAGARLEIYDNTSAAGTAVATITATKANHVVRLKWPNGLYLDTGCYIKAVTGNFELQSLSARGESRGGAVA